MLKGRRTQVVSTHPLDSYEISDDLNRRKIQVFYIINKFLSIYRQFLYIFVLSSARAVSIFSALFFQHRLFNTLCLWFFSHGISHNKISLYEF